MMAKDGEGATKLIICEVSGAPDAEAARGIARSVVGYPLCKTAMFGAEANWGRILCAIGYAPGDFSVDSTCVTIASPAGSVHVCEAGSGIAFSEEEAKRVLLAQEITIRLGLGQGEAAATAWGCGLTYGYVQIHGDYRP